MGDGRRGRSRIYPALVAPRRYPGRRRPCLGRASVTPRSIRPPAALSVADAAAECPRTPRSAEAIVTASHGKGAGPGLRSRGPRAVDAHTGPIQRAAAESGIFYKTTSLAFVIYLHFNFGCVLVCAGFNVCIRREKHATGNCHSRKPECIYRTSPAIFCTSM
jgi:hypothetical protein